MPRSDWRIELRRAPATELRTLRNEAGLTQAVAAERWGVSANQYGKYERCQSEIPASLLVFARQGFQKSSSQVKGFEEEAVAYISSPAGIRPTLREHLRQLLGQMERPLRDANELVSNMKLLHASLKVFAQEIEPVLGANRAGR